MGVHSTTANHTMHHSYLLLLYITCVIFSVKGDDTTIQFTQAPRFTAKTNVTSNQSHIEIEVFLSGNPLRDYTTIHLWKDNDDSSIAMAERLPSPGEPVVIVTQLDPCTDQLNLYIKAHKTIGRNIISKMFDYD